MCMEGNKKNLSGVVTHAQCSLIRNFNLAKRRRKSEPGLIWASLYQLRLIYQRNIKQCWNMRQTIFIVFRRKKMKILSFDATSLGGFTRQQKIVNPMWLPSMPPFGARMSANFRGCLRDVEGIVYDLIRLLFILEPFHLIFLCLAEHLARAFPFFWEWARLCSGWWSTLRINDDERMWKIKCYNRRNHNKSVFLSNEMCVMSRSSWLGKWIKLYKLWTFEIFLL